MNKLKNFPYKRVLVLGLAKSGTATCNVLSRNGVHVIANDLKAQEADPEIAQLKAKGIELVLGEHPLSLLDQVDLVIKNPGIPYHNEMISEAASKGIPIWTEIECLNYLIDNPILAITGSNGKTTTTTLCHDILRQSQQPVQLAGNIGRVAIEVAEQLKDNEKLVLELSSFQLKGVMTFKPKIAVFLNLFEAHLDYHGDFLDYQQAKANIFAQLTAEDYLVYNADDARVSKLVQSSTATRVPFSTTTKLDDGAWADKTHIYFKDQKIIDLTSIRLVGAHNLENILASVASTLLLGATVEGIRETLTTFNGVKHRLQFVAEKQGRLFYNDSKATNILASSKALTAFNKPIHLIAGGLDRGNGFDDLIPFLDHVKGMYLYGQTADKLAVAGKKAKIKEVLTGETLQNMVESAYQNAQPGEVILLSPACASWDQFKTFEERGDMFIKLVHTL